MLRAAGIVSRETISPEIDEYVDKKELPRQHALRLAREKADKVAKSRPGCFVLAADTVVACGRRILPKAADKKDVIACLELLSGRRHVVHTGVALALPDGTMRARLVSTRVIFKRLTPREIEAYAASGEGVGKAGGYAIQGRAAAFARAINGSYTNVVGLPLTETLALLEGGGFPIHS